MLFSALIPAFLDYQQVEESNSAGELAQKRMCLANHLAPHFGQLELATITSRTMRAYAASKRQGGLSAKTVNNHLIILTKFLRFAQLEGEIEEVPKCRREKLSAKIDMNYLEHAELQRLLQAASLQRDPMWQLAMQVAVNTGLRIGELMALKWAHIDIARERITVCQSYCRVSKTDKAPKSGKARIVHLNDNAMAALMHMRAHSTGANVFVFNYTAAEYAMQRAVKVAKLSKHVTWHTLRHTFASMLAMRGVPLFTVSKLLGHASVRMTERYSHLYDDSARNAVKLLAAVG